LSGKKDESKHVDLRAPLSKVLSNSASDHFGELGIPRADESRVAIYGGLARVRERKQTIDAALHFLERGKFALGHSQASESFQIAGGTPPAHQRKYHLLLN
jgi:hypothetical protein